MGIGKSQTVKECAKQLAKELKMEFSDTDVENGKFGFVDVRLSQLEAVDLRGLPKIENNKTCSILPEFLPRKAEGKGILFFDEYPNAPPSVQNASLQLVLDRKLGSYVMPDGWLVVTAGNLETDKAHLFSLSAPLMNRFIHLELATPSIESWTSWATEHNLDTRWIAFLNWKPGYLYRFDPKASDKAFPTPRMNEYVSRLIGDIQGDYQLLETLIASAVGEGVAVEFTAWYRLAEKIDLDTLIEKPEKIASIKEVSMKYSVVSGLAEKYKGDSKLADKLFEVCKFLEAEYSVLLLKLMFSVNKMDLQKKMVMGNKKWVEIAKQYAKYFDFP